MARTLSKDEKAARLGGLVQERLPRLSRASEGRNGQRAGLGPVRGKHCSAKPWKGQGAGVFEVVDDHAGDTYRAVYTVCFKEVVYVLHAFQKKSPKGMKSARTDVDLVERRLKIAQQDYEGHYGKPKR